MADFLIQRFATVNWPFVLGHRPFIVTGPRFHAYTTTSVLKHEWRFRSGFIDDIESVGETCDRLSREIVAELFLREGIVQALWAVNSRECLPEDERWNASIKQVADEIPSTGELKFWVIELLSGMIDAGNRRNYVAEAELELVPVTIPAD